MELHILDILKAIILGVVEGFTEFLPISSTGHLILVNQFVSFDKEFTVLFDIVIQLGAILAVLFYFIKKLWPFTIDKTHNKKTMTIWYKTIVGVLPAMVLGFFLVDFITQKLFTPWVVAVSLLVGGVIIIFIERKHKSADIVAIEDLSYKQAFSIGLVQCLAMIPGVSRSGATIMGSMVLGASRMVATEFSFFLAIPTMLAASVYSLLKYKGVLSMAQVWIVLVGFVVSFVVALCVIRFLIGFVQKQSFKIFGYYRIVLGILIILYFLIR